MRRYRRHEWGLLGLVLLCMSVVALTLIISRPGFPASPSQPTVTPRAQWPPPPTKAVGPIRVVPDAPPDAPALQPGAGERIIGLTKEEYQFVMESAKAVQALAGARGWDLTRDFVATKGPRILMGMPLWILALVVIRTVFRQLWDRDVRGHPYASAMVLDGVLLSTAIAFYALMK